MRWWVWGVRPHRFRCKYRWELWFCRWSFPPRWDCSLEFIRRCERRNLIQSKRCERTARGAAMAQAHGENLKQAMDTLRAHKLRSGLTVFGVVLGVSVIMLVSALITGFDYQIQENIKQFGADTAFISKWDQGFHGGNRPLEERMRKPLTLEDSQALIAGCPALKNITTFLQTGWMQ